MQKINLLPSYYQDRKRIAIAWVVVGVLVALEIGCVLAWRTSLSGQLAAVNTEVDKNNQGVQQMTQLKGDADKATQEVSIYDPSLNTMKSMRVYNLKRPALYQQAANYIYNNATVLGMSSTSTVLTLECYVSNIGDLSRTFLYLHRNPEFTGVTLNAVPAFKTATKTPVYDPSEAPPSEFGSASPYGGGSLPGGMSGGMGGMYGGMSGGRRGPMANAMAGAGAMSGGMGPMMSGGMGGGMSGGMGGMSGGMGRSGKFGGMMGGGMSGGMPGMSGGGGGNNNGGIPGIDFARLPVGREPLGNVVVFACALKDPITREGGEAQGGGGGGMGGMMSGGMGRMMSGGMGGMMSGGMGGGMTGGGRNMSGGGMGPMPGGKGQAAP